MDFRRIFQEDELRNEVPWNTIPVTPSKPIPTRPKPIDRQGNQQQGIPNWFESVAFPAEFFQESQSSNGVTASQNPMVFVDQNSGVSNWEEDFSAKPRGFSDLLNSYGQLLSDTGNGSNNMGYTDLLALTGLNSEVSGSVTQMGSYNGAAASSSSLPISHSQIDNGLQNSTANGMHLFDQNFPMDSNLWNNNYSQSQHIPQYGFPVPYRPSYDLDSSSRTLSNMVSNGSMSFHLAPVTPDHRNRAQEKQLSEIGNVCQEERSYLEKNMQQEAVVQIGNNGVELQCEESLLQSVVESSLAAVSTPFKENHVLDKAGENGFDLNDQKTENGIDLNKTPQQKPKRRKIRPRVVVEGKPKKTPKSTVKKNPNVEKTSVKRKYVRKNGIKPSNAPLVDVVEEVIDDQVAVKSCKRTLDFNLEEDARDECHVPTQDQQEGLLHSIVDSSSSRSTCNYDSDTPAQDICTGINGSSRTQSSMQFPEGLEVVENSPTGIPFDLNCSLTQILDDCMSMPKKAAPSTPPLTRQDPPREDLDVLSSNRYNMGRAGPYQSSGVKYCPPELQIFHPNETSCTLFQTRNTNGNPLRENLNVLASSNVYNMGIAGPCQNSGKEGWTPRLQLLHQNETSCRVFQTSNTHGNHEIAVPYMFQRGTRPMSQNNTNCNSHVRLAEGEQARGSKRGYYHTINEAHVNSMNLIGSHYNSLQVYQEMLQRNQYQRNNCSADLQVPETYKKTRTENNHNTVNSSVYSSVPSVLHGAREAMGCRQNYANTSPLTSHTNNGGMTPQYGYTNVIRNLQNGSGSSVPNEYSQAMANLHKQVQTIAELHAHKDILSKEAIDKLKASNLALTSGRAYKGNKKPEGSTQTSELTSLTETVDWSPTTPAKMAKIKGDRQYSKTIPGPQNYTEVLAVKKQTETARRKRSKTGLSLVNSVAYNTENNERLHRREAAVYNFHPNVKSRGPLHLAWLPNDPIDEIVRRLSCLNINDGSNMTSIQEQNALVPYGGDGQMVPYDPIKKKLPRPKVDLDPETDRVWKLLMGPAGSGVEGTNEDKEKWWEEERRVFRGRADSFIARMHLIQGDRRFTKWKGSVLDSVIGVFLTQNVSDHLSSSAFISLAARFPLKSTSGSETHYKERIDILVKEPDVCIIDSDDTIVWHEATSSKQVCDPGSFSLHEAEPVEERGESGKRDESFGINAAGHTSLVDNLKSIDDKVVEPNSREQMHSSDKAPSRTSVNVSKSKGRIEKAKKEAFDWDSLRKEVNQKGLKREESKNTMDSLDWEAVRCADVGEIAKAIKERGMNNMLAERIKDLLNRLVKEHGSINLEWLRDVPPDKAKEYLLSIRGLGLKSVECVRLLTLHHLAFPVDTNVGRIAVRLGWVPLQPLPESLQLHLLEMYPILETIQKYLWPRLCTLDQPTLYELHYQLITFGKVFCTKSKPNCNACPMRAECKHFASAFASARLALPGPEEQGIMTSFSPIPNNQNPAMSTKTVPVPLLEADPLSQSRSQKDCEPIVEEPATPENECIGIAESDIEDAIYECPNEIPSIDLNFEEFTLNLQNYMQENNMELQEGEVSKALVAITPQAASIPIPKLKNVNRLRTEHQVYELPDSHPLLEEVPRRDPDDHVSYLLAIWTPGETAESIQPPERCCGSQASGNLCDDKTCFLCNSIREANTQTVRGTLLIPCKTAMRGSFPLNGTYFQVNEVFADHASSLNPIDVPRAWIWNLPRRTVLFGTSIPTIFKGQSTQEIQNCFWKGYVCVRGFDQKLRIPRPLMARLHFPASKLAKNKTDMHKE